MFFGPVDQDVADRRVLEQHLQRPQAEGLVEHLLDQPLAFVAIQQRVFGVAQVLDDQADLAAQHVALQFADLGQVELVDQLAVDALFECVEFLGLGPRRPSVRREQSLPSCCPCTSGECLGTSRHAPGVPEFRIWLMDARAGHSSAADSPRQ